MRALVWFFTLTFAATWSCFTAARWVGASNVGLHAFVFRTFLLLGTFAPGLVALALTQRAEGRPGTTALLRRAVQWEVGARWYVFAVGYFTAIKLITAALYRVVTGAWPEFGPTPWLLLLGATALSTWAQAGEELGWRGYALPRLATRMRLGWAGVVLGMIWATWHLPLFYLPGPDTYGQSFPLYLVQVTGISVAIAWLYGHTGGSVLLPMLMHAAVNNMRDILPALPRPAVSPLVPDAPLLGWLGAGVIWAAAVGFLLTMPKARAHETAHLDSPSAERPAAVGWAP